MVVLPSDFIFPLHLGKGGFESVRPLPPVDIGGDVLGVAFDFRVVGVQRGDAPVRAEHVSQLRKGSSGHPRLPELVGPVVVAVRLVPKDNFLSALRSECSRFRGVGVDGTGSELPLRIRHLAPCLTVDVSRCIPRIPDVVGTLHFVLYRLPESPPYKACGTNDLDFSLLRRCSKRSRGQQGQPHADYKHQ